MKNIAFERSNPVRRPDWRFERVLQLVEGHPKPVRASPYDDVYVRGLRHFLLFAKALAAGHKQEAKRQHLAYKHAGCYYAYQFYQFRNTSTKHDVETIEARILARVSDEEIAAEFGTEPEAIEWYEACFFNVRDRLQCHDWVLNRVLMPAADIALGAPLGEHQTATYAKPFFDFTLKFFAYFGGNIILNHALSGFRRGVMPSSPEEAMAWYNGTGDLRTAQRMSDAVGTCDINKYNLTELLNFHARIREIEKSNDSVESKRDQLHRCVSAVMLELPWGVGDQGAENLRGTPAAGYDAGAAELRDHELLRLSAGGNPGTIEGVATLTLPPPRQRAQTAGQEDQAHAPHAQQGS